MDTRESSQSPMMKADHNQLQAQIQTQSQNGVQSTRRCCSVGVAIATTVTLGGLALGGFSHRAIADDSVNDASVDETVTVARVSATDGGSPPQATIDSAPSTSAPSTSEPSDTVVPNSSEVQEVAVAPQFLTLNNYPVELDLLDPDADLSGRNVITDTMISQDNLTLPSLWWAQDQFGGKLLENWLAYPGSTENPRRVDMVVDRQLWGLSSYLQRYSFVNYFGTAAKEFGYSLRVFNDQGHPMASYMCNFSDLDADDRAALEVGTYEFENIDCSVSLDSSGSGALRGRSDMFETFF